MMPYLGIKNCLEVGWGDRMKFLNWFTNKFKRTIREDKSIEEKPEKKESVKKFAVKIVRWGAVGDYFQILYSYHTGKPIWKEVYRYLGGYRYSGKFDEDMDIMHNIYSSLDTAQKLAMTFKSYQDVLDYHLKEDNKQKVVRAKREAELNKPLYEYIMVEEE